MSRAREAANWISTGVTGAEIDKLDGFTGTVDDLNYAKDLRATGVTSTEYDYLDGVGSNLQTQLNAAAALAGASFTGDITMSTTTKVKQKGAFMQSSTHQALTLGY